MWTTLPELLKLIVRLATYHDAQRLVRYAPDPRKETFDASLGLPHHGHLFTSTIKDIILRYWLVKGFHVVRRLGWDIHGVPIEYEI